MPANHVIVAVPDAADRERLAAALRGLGYQVITAEDARVTGEVLVASDADCLLLGLDMPGLDRRALLRALESVTAKPESLEVVEREHIEAVLRETGGNRSRAARMLGISRSTLLAKIRRYQLPR